MQPYEYLKALKIKASLSNKEIAQKSQVSESNVSRIISGENDNPSILSLVPIVKVLQGSLDKMFGIAENEDESLRSLAGSLRQRVEDQRDIITGLQESIARQDAFHAQRLADIRESHAERFADLRTQLEREQARVDSLQREIRRIRVINTAVALTIAVVAVVALYVVIDALNGGWGLIRY